MKIQFDPNLDFQKQAIESIAGVFEGQEIGQTNFTVEMETGTGKTYVYLRSIFEMNRLCGFTKFIIVVPSIAIKEGVTYVLEDVVFVLHTDDKPESIAYAVPYLQDKDIRTVEPGETIDDKNTKLVEGLKNHYADVCAIAEKMGHLFTAGGKTVDGDGVRELYVGSLDDIHTKLEELKKEESSAMRMAAARKTSAGTGRFR